MPRIIFSLFGRVSFFFLFSFLLSAMALAAPVNAGSFINRSTTFNNLDLVRLEYYSDNSCSTSMGIAPASTAGGVSFADGQSYQINAEAVYTIAVDQAFTVSDARCIKVTLEDVADGHTFLVVGTGVKPEFQITCSSGSCFTSTGTLDVE